MKNNTVGYKIFTFFNYIIMISVFVTMLYPYLNVITRSFDATISMGFSLKPEKFTFNNYITLFDDSSIVNAAIISVLRVVIAVVLSVATQFLAAYALTKKELVGKNIIITFFMLPMFIYAGQIPTYVTLSNYGLLNNFWVYILPSLFSFYNVIIIRTFIESTIPDSLNEAAEIDGASELLIFTKIILPLCKPIMATVALWIMVQHWNDYSTTLLYVRKPSLQTLQYKMMELIKESDRLQKLQSMAMQNGIVLENQEIPQSENLISAQIIISTLPIVMVYPFLQKHFVNGIVVGSVKG